MKKIIFTAGILLLFLSTLAAAPRFSEAGWLWAGDKNDAPLKAYLRREINIKEPVKEAFFYAFADKRKTYYFNGKKIELRPWKKLPRTFGHVKGDGLDLTHLLKPGKNVLAVELERFKDKRYCYGLMLYGEIKYASGKKELLRSTAREFKASGIFQKGWNTPNFDSSKWKNAFYQGDVTMKPWATYGNVPLLYCTPEEFKAYRDHLTAGFPAKRLAAENKKVKAKIVYRNHIPGVEINGKILPPFTATVNHASDPERDQLISATGKRGMHLVRLGMDIVSCNGDFTHLDFAVRRILAKNPEAYILIGYREIPDASWMKRNPDELVKYAVKSKSTHYGNYSANPPAPSYASEKVKVYFEQKIKELGEYCVKQPWGHRILGMINSHGGSGDGMPPGCHAMPDVGKRMTEKFRLFLKAKYKTADALQKAWGDSKVTFDNAQVPDAAARWGSGMYLRDTGDPKDRRVLDYYTCYHKEFSGYIHRQMKAIKKYLPGRLAGCFSGYIILGYPPEGSSAFFEEMLRSPDVDIMYATTRGYNLTDGLHRHNHSVFHRYGKLSSVEADIRPHHDNTCEKQWQCKTPEETRATMSKVIANCFFSGTGFHLVPFSSSYRFNTAETLEPIAAGVKVWKKLFNAPPRKNADIAVILDHDQIWKQGHPSYGRTRPFSDTLVTFPLQTMNFSGFAYDLLALEDYLDSQNDYRCVVFLNSFEIAPKQKAALLKKLRRPGVTAVWNYAPGLITPAGYSSRSMSELTGMDLKFIKKVLPVSAKDQLNREIAPTLDRYMKIGPRIICTDARAKVLARYSNDKTVAAAEKELKGGARSVFAGIPMTSSAWWHKIFTEAGCRKYTPAGYMVRKNDKVMMVFSFADGHIPPESLIQKGQIDRSGKVSVDIGRKSRYARDLFTGEIFKARNGKITVQNKHPRCLLLELK